MKTPSKFRNLMTQVGTLLFVLFALSLVSATAGCVPTGYPYYDPTNIIQSVVDYRQDVMDWSNDAWDEYIRE